MIHYVTCNIQKDGRINLGTAVHARRCAAVKGRRLHVIAGAIVDVLPKCKKCGAKR